MQIIEKKNLVIWKHFYENFRKHSITQIKPQMYLKEESYL